MTKNSLPWDFKKCPGSLHFTLLQEEKKPKRDDVIALKKWIINKETDINEELFKKHFNFQRPSNMLVHLNKTNDTEKSNKLVNLINSGLKDLKRRY